MPMSFRAGPAGAKECHDRDGKEHFPVLCHGSIRATLDSATEQHWAKSLQLSFPTDGMSLITSWWLLRQVDGYNWESCNQLASPLGAQKSREAPAPGHAVKGAWDGEDHNTPAQRLYAGPSCGSCTAAEGALRWAVLSVRFTHAGTAGHSLPALNQVWLPILLMVAST